ncbi:hypothetical protein Tdes44962_MAKER03922 [Teratosphaeria destructans]|uniref:Uncharacterized protein n=1 Tax=Teratosphaeria destructans TaxID=418781 RepID=A0A9W7W0K1_9PEZI|nr:hypothetical protein Tdes44962_MAKER03922 [Teratosphaeria destructans]
MMRGLAALPFIGLLAVALTEPIPEQDDRIEKRQYGYGGYGWEGGIDDYTYDRHGDFRPVAPIWLHVFLLVTKRAPDRIELKHCWTYSSVEQLDNPS